MAIDDAMVFLPPEPACYAPKAASLADHYNFVISLKALIRRRPLAGPWPAGSQLAP